MLEEIYQIYYEKIQHYFQKRVGDEYQAEDLTQDVFVKVFLALPKTKQMTLRGGSLRLLSLHYMIFTVVSGIFW